MSNLPKTKNLVSIGQAAGILGVSIDTIRRWDKKGKVTSIRPDGKNRLFAVSELESLKNKENSKLSISEASSKLGVSASTLRRYEEKGLIKPGRNNKGERLYTNEAINAFKKGGDKRKEQEKPEQKKAKKIVKRRPVRKVERTKLRHSYNYPTFLIVILLITTIFSTLYIQEKYRSNYDKVQTTYTKVLGAKDEGGVIGFFGKISDIIKATNNRLAFQYKSMFRVNKIADVNEIFEYDDDGNLVPKVTINITQPGLLKIKETVSVIQNLDAESLQGKVPGIEDGDIAVFSAGGQITGLLVSSFSLTPGSVFGGTGGVILDSSITSADLADDAVSSSEILNGTIVNADIADGAINSAKIEDGTVTSSDINDGTIVEADLSDNSVTTGKIAGNTITAADLSATITLSDGDFLDLAAIVHNDSALQGLRLPNVSSASPTSLTSGEGFLAYDTAGNQVLVYDGSSWVGIGGSVTLATGGGLEYVSEELTLLSSCGSGQVLKWGGSSWACGNDSGAGGSGISVVERNNADVVTTAASLDFSTDFGVALDTGEAENEADITIDYATSGITRDDQTQTISGTWTFSGVTEFTGNITANDAGADTILIGQNGATDDTVTIAGIISLTDDDWSIDSTGATTGLSGITADAVAFSGVSGATNTNALVIGTNGSLSISGSGTITATDLSCTGCIGPTEITDLTLGTDTAGNYVASVTNGSGISGGDGGGEGSGLTLALGALTANWSQTGAFDIVLGNASSELQILESVGATYYGTLDVGNLGADATYTFSGTTGTVLTTANYTTTLDSDYVDVDESPASADISGNFATGLTIGANSVTLGTDTTEDYVDNVTGGNGIAVTGTPGEGWEPAVAVDLLGVQDGSGATFSYSGLEMQGASSDKLTLLQGCSDAQILKWDDESGGNGRWDCAADGGGGGGTLQDAYDGGNSIETASNVAVVITETTVAVNTNDLLQLTINPATGGTSSGDGLQITMDAADASGNTGHGLRIIVDVSQSTGNPILVEDDGATALFSVSEAGAVDIASTITAGSSNISVTDSSGYVLHDALVDCTDGQILKWAIGGGRWGCAADASGGGGVFAEASGVITKVTAGNRLNLVYGDAADVQLTIDSSTNTIVPTADALVLDLTSGATNTGIVTGGVDGLVINIEFGDEGTNQVNSAIHLNIDPVAIATSDDTFYAINIDGLAAGTSATETAINIGANWDTAIVFQNGESINNSSNNEIELDVGTSGTLLLTSGTAATITNSAGTLTIDSVGDSVLIGSADSLGNGTWSISSAGVGTTLTATDLSCTGCIGPTEITDLTLGTDTAGNYVASISNGTGITGGDGGSEGAGLTLALDTAASLTWTADHTFTLTGAEDIAVTHDLAGTINVVSITGTSNSSANTAYGLYIDQADSANANGFDAALVIDNSDITGAVIGAAIKTIDAGGGFTNLFDIEGTLISVAEFNVLDAGIALGTETTGNYVDDVTGGNGIAVSGTPGEGWKPAVAVDLLGSADGTGLTTNNSGFEFAGGSSDTLALLQGCSDNQILKWDEGGSTWNCEVDGGGGGGAWSDLTDPGGALTLAHGTNATTMGFTPTAALNAWTFDITNEGASATVQNGLVINNTVTGTFTDLNTESLLLLDNEDTTAASSTIVDNGLLITVSGAIANGIVDAIDASDANITNAINIGANAIAGTNFSVSTAGAITAPTSTDTINGLIINSGALSGVSTLGLSGAISGATSTDTINGIVINSGAVSGVSTLGLSGAISGGTTLGLSGAISGQTTTDTINGLIINSGALSGVSTLGLSGAISGGTTLGLSGAISGQTATDTINGLIINSGALSGATTIAASGTVTIGTGGDTFTFDPSSGPTYAGTARPAKTVTIVPEFAGATLTGDGGNNIGTMISDFCSSTRNINEASTPTNAAPCDLDLTEEHNYYTWSTTQGTAQDYDIWVRWQVPSDFAAFAASNAVQAYGWRLDATTNVVEVSLFDTAGSADATSVNVATGTGQWTITTVDTSPSGTYTPGSYATFQIHMIGAPTDGDNVKIGEIEIDYLAKF